MHVLTTKTSGQPTHVSAERMYVIQDTALAPPLADEALESSGGQFNSAPRSYLDRIVVRAVRT